MNDETTQPRKTTHTEKAEDVEFSGMHKNLGQTDHKVAR